MLEALGIISSADQLLFFRLYFFICISCWFLAAWVYHYVQYKRETKLQQELDEYKKMIDESKNVTSTIVKAPIKPAQKIGEVRYGYDGSQVLTRKQRLINNERMINRFGWNLDATD